MLHEKYFISLVLFGLLFFPKKAHAYIDPGTGSMMLQALIGGIAAGLVIIRLYWTKLKEFFLSRSAQEPQSQDKESESDSKRMH